MSSQNNLDGSRLGWQIVEENDFDRAVAQIADHRYIDEALAPIEYALHQNPQGFPEVPGFAGIHLAKTKIRVFVGGIMPSYRLWFRVNLEARTVYKLWVEIAPPEDMGYTDDIFSDDWPF